MFRYEKPKTLAEAAALLAECEWRVLAGGTDFYPGQGSRPIRENILDINGLDELRGIRETGGHYVIGARTSWSAVLAHPLGPAFDALKQAAREVGSVQIQKVGTVAGNLCNASPAADGVPPLLVLDAEVELASATGTRALSLPDFILGNRRTARRSDELVTAIRAPKGSAVGGSAFQKLGSRRYLVISIAMAAVRLVTDRSGRIGAAAVAVGSCSPVAARLSSLERVLLGLECTGSRLAAAVSEASLAELSPIDDVRASADYRLGAAREIVMRALLEAARLSERAAA